MTPRHRVSRAAIALIKRFEGYRQKAAQLPDERWTIGYGHTLTARQGAEVSLDDAEALLIYDLIAVTHALNEQLFVPLNQNQFDALTSFAFNVGLDNFGSSGVLKRLNEGALVQAACAMELWRKAEFQGARIVIDALVRRRAAEKLLFLTPPGDAWVPAPSPILKPVLDTDAHDIVPRQLPAQVSTSLVGETVVVTRDDAPGPAATPEPERDDAGPARAAAESITARLQTIFPDPGLEPGEPRAVEPPVHPENIPATPHPQADFGPPVDVDIDEPFVLVAPLEDEDDLDLATQDEHERTTDEPAGPDLFDEPTAANDLMEDVEQFGRDDGAPRLVIDDAAPFDFGAAVPRPLPEQPKNGLLSLVALAILGLAFFAGGVFWATNARASLEPAAFSPMVVGWLAGVAGVIFFAVAVFLLLQRLGQVSERAARTRHR
jgi:lysozyme